MDAVKVSHSDPNKHDIEAASSLMPHDTAPLQNELDVLYHKCEDLQNKLASVIGLTDNAGKALIESYTASLLHINKRITDLEKSLN